MANVTDEPKICEKGGSGLWLPLGGDAEAEWPSELKIVLYLLGLIYCFLGVAIIADVFMSAIEKVTSVKKQVMDKETQKKVTVKVWNDTVANLTLMALGSSAPEILLSIIELVGADFYSGSLGASTIVGSAAFNLLASLLFALLRFLMENSSESRIKKCSLLRARSQSSRICGCW